MGDYKVVAKRYGDSVKFEVQAEDVKDALHRAKVEANRIFDFHAGETAPTVSVQPIEEKD